MAKKKSKKLKFTKPKKIKKSVKKPKKFLIKPKKITLRKTQGKKKKLILKKKLIRKKTKKIAVKKFIRRVVSKKQIKKIKPQKQEIKKESKVLGNYTASEKDFFKAKIKVIGIGGGGSSIVSEIGKSLHKATFLVADSDMRSSNKRTQVKRFLFGQDLTRGMGTGGLPELGMQAAEESREKIGTFFQDQDIVILIASLGGGFGSGAAQVFADVARDFNGITFGIFTLPFKFEGKNKQAVALKALKNLQKSLNVSLTISNEKIFTMIDNSVAITQAFSMVNKHLINLLESLIDLIYNPGIINIDFADLKTILKTKGSLAFLNTAEASGKNRAEQVTEKILHNSLYQSSRFECEKILFNIAGGNNLSLLEVDKISRAISELHKDAKIIFGISKNPKLKNKIKTTLLMTGPGSEIKKEMDLAKKVAVKTKAATKKTLAVIKKLPKAPVILKQKKERIKKNINTESRKKIPQVLTPLPDALVPVFSSASFESEFAGANVKKMETIQVSNKKAIRRSGLEIEKARKIEENKQSLQEEEWEIPAFLRLKK